jgi:hypothetical protein
MEVVKLAEEWKALAEKEKGSKASWLKDEGRRRGDMVSALYHGVCGKRGSRQRDGSGPQAAN